MDKNEILILAAVGAVAFILLRKPAATTATAGTATGTTGATAPAANAQAAWDNASALAEQTDYENRWPGSYLHPNNTDNPTGDPIITGQLK